jgi:hypothetical protein
MNSTSALPPGCIAVFGRCAATATEGNATATMALLQGGDRCAVALPLQVVEQS